MTSPAPFSSYNPICSYCHKEVKNPLLFYLNKDLHWACCKKCKFGLIEDEKLIDNPNILLKKLIKMYVEVYRDLGESYNRPFIKRIFNIK